MEKIPLLQVENLCKSYSGVPVLDRVSLRLDGGEIVALAGENGAGKSTFVKCVSGEVPFESGNVRFSGVEYSPLSVPLARKLGVAVIPQEFRQAPHLSAAENIFLGGEPRRLGLLDRKRMLRESRILLDRLGGDFDPSAPAGELGSAQKQLIEIARALRANCRILIMDEPTTVLNPPESARLFDIVRRLKAEGAAVLFISHKLDEVVSLCDRVAVFRDGASVGEFPVDAEMTPGRIASLMVGREFNTAFPPKLPFPDGPPALELRGVTRKKLVSDVSFAVRPGEIFGLAGLGGAGRTELAEVIYGAGRIVSGEIRVFGKKVEISGVRDAVKLGIACLSEDRQRYGVIASFPVGWNCSLAALGKFCRSGFILFRREREAARQKVAEFGVKTPSVDTLLRQLSGGNQQKCALIKALETNPAIFLFDEPTRGIDIRSRREIYRLIRELARRGMACVLISSDMEELIGLCSRVGVMRRGRLAGILSGSELSEHHIITLATGVK